MFYGLYFPLLLIFFGYIFLRTVNTTVSCHVLYGYDCVYGCVRPSWHRFVSNVFHIYILYMPLYLPILRWKPLVATLEMRYIIARIWRTTATCCWIWSTCAPSCGKWTRLRVSLSRPRLKWVMACDGMVWSNHRAKSHKIWNFTLCVRNMHNHDAIHAEINIWD